MPSRSVSLLRGRITSVVGVLALSCLVSGLASNLSAGTYSYAAPADFDGDGRADISRKLHTGRWIVDFSAGDLKAPHDVDLAGFGGFGAIPVPADYDGDGKADLSTKTETGEWYIDYARDGFGGWNPTYTGFGPKSYHPVPADYDGDGKADLSVKSDTGEWYIDYARDGFGGWNPTYLGFGPESYHPVPADYDGDGKTDLSVKSDTGEWYIDYAKDGFGGWNPTYLGYGPRTSHPVPADYDGDGKADLSVHSTDDNSWYIDYAADGFGSWDAVHSVTCGETRNNGPDVRCDRVPADYDGDGKADIGVKGDDEWWYVNFAYNDFVYNALGEWKLEDALGPPMTPSPELDERTAYSLTVSVDARFADAEGHSAASQLVASLRDVPGTRKSAPYPSYRWFFKDLKPNTRYCVDVMAVNDEGQALNVACFNTDKAPPPPPPDEEDPPPPPAQGKSRINVFNCHPEEHTLHIWMFDSTLGVWEERGSLEAQWSSNGCPSGAAPFVVELADGHTYRFVAVDPEWCGGENDPQNGGCQKAYFTVTGDADGPAFRWLIN